MWRSGRTSGSQCWHVSGLTCLTGHSLSALVTLCPLCGWCPSGFSVGPSFNFLKCAEQLKWIRLDNVFYKTHADTYSVQYSYLLAKMTAHFSSTQNSSFGESTAFWHLNTQSHSLLPHLGNCTVTFTSYNSASGGVRIRIFNLKRWCESDTSISVLERACVHQQTCLHASVSFWTCRINILPVLT